MYLVSNRGGYDENSIDRRLATFQASRTYNVYGFPIGVFLRRLEEFSTPQTYQLTDTKPTITTTKRIAHHRSSFVTILKAIVFMAGKVGKCFFIETSSNPSSLQASSAEKLLSVKLEKPYLLTIFQYKFKKLTELSQNESSGNLRFNKLAKILDSESGLPRDLVKTVRNEKCRKMEAPNDGNL